MLAEVAKSPLASYETRLDAALSVRKLKGDPLTATDPELAALSAQQLPADTQTASPFAFRLRAEIAAAQRDPATQERLLLAVAAPDLKTPKLPIFKAALAARHDALTEAIGGQLVPAYSRGRFEGGANYADFLNTLSDADRVTVARGLADANQRLGNTRVALNLYLLAQQIQPSDGLRRSADGLRAQLSLEARNAARRPLVTDKIDQDHMVRPRETK
jgi:hypothetical protein